MCVGVAPLEEPLVEPDPLVDPDPPPDPDPLPDPDPDPLLPDPELSPDPLPHPDDDAPVGAGVTDALGLVVALVVGAGVTLRVGDTDRDGDLRTGAAVSRRADVDCASCCGR